ncbi:MAG: PhzF family phenazine biosynthesis protein [Candidatus Omnitrophica bacterium]|nr:PhzF family phenazine biosynthesis protein [Candidatus Omnitrophota bacterium]
MKKPLYIVDVFAEKKFSGNPLAVVCDAEDLSPKQMQLIAKEMNYSETTFIKKIHDDRQNIDVRIFTPSHEIPFAGHPLIGTAFIIQQEIIQQDIPKISFQLEIGPIDMTLSNDNIIWLKPIKPFLGAKIPSNILAKVLQIPSGDINHAWPIQEVNMGLHVIIVPLNDCSAVEKVNIKLEQYYTLIKQTKSKAILVFSTETLFEENDLHVRVFADYYGIPEDPATGSANAGLAAYIAQYQCFNDTKEILRVEQGYELNRPSLLYIQSKKSDGVLDIQIGGEVQLIAKGELYL